MNGVISDEGPFAGATARGRVEYPCLVVEASPQTEEVGLQFILLSPQVTLGRDAGCALALKDPALSLRHAVLSLALGPEGNQPVVMYSDRTTPDVTGMLRPGDVLQVGGTSLRYCLSDLEPLGSSRLASTPCSASGARRSICSRTSSTRTARTGSCA